MLINTLHGNHILMLLVRRSQILLGRYIRGGFYLRRNPLLSLYYTLIYPYLTYCNLIWASTYVTNLERIYLLQKRAVRLISKTDYRVPSKPSLYENENFGYL